MKFFEIGAEVHPCRISVAGNRIGGFDQETYEHSVYSLSVSKVFESGILSITSPCCPKSSTKYKNADIVSKKVDTISKKVDKNFHLKFG